MDYKVIPVDFTTKSS